VKPADLIGRIGRSSALVVLALMVVLGLFLAVVGYTDAGSVAHVTPQGSTLSSVDLSRVPNDVRQDAWELAGEMVGRHSDQRNEFVQQLLTTYLQAQDRDFVILYNPGGWGYSQLKDSPGWTSIVAGMEAKLNSQGYNFLPLSYRRTQEGWLASLDEMSEMAVHYDQKAKALAARLNFLTSHNPRVRVIMASESNGGIISDKVMLMLEDNDRVFDIQMGSPFWYRPESRERTLVINDNGETPDSFSRGDVFTIMFANLKALFTFSFSDASGGHILKIFRAPGHYYSWEQPLVAQEVSDFLDQILAGMRPG